MKRSLEKHLESMSIEERNAAIKDLRSIVYEIERYSSAYFGTPHGSTSSVEQAALIRTLCISGYR